MQNVRNRVFATVFHAAGWIGCSLVMAFPTPRLRAEPALTLDEAQGAMRRAVAFLDEQASAEGGYLWRYSADLARREGEGQAGPQTAWVQPPGTPTVGETLLRAFQRTGDREALDAARRTARALVRGQLHSGGWDYRIEFDPAARRRYAYRVDGPAGTKRNVTTLDDNTTQAALRFLMHIDRELGFEDEAIHEAVRYALDHLQAAQYPNGAWPQRFSESPDPAKYPVRKANYPEDWPREYPGQDYRDYYTFNDNTIADMISTMFEAGRIYEQAEYRKSAERGGEFILLAQMPDPQPAWAQQYNAAMQPAWAHKFEPPAVTGGESQQVLRTLLDLYRETGDTKYLEPVPRALAYLRKSQLPDGRLARFYELKTNRPLFFTTDYELTYRPDDLPTHYGFLVGSRLDSIQREYERLRDTPWKRPAREGSSDPPRLTQRLTAEARGIVDQLDERGAWVEEGRLQRFGDEDATRRIIDTRTFVRNLDLLSRFIAAAQADDPLH